MLSGHKWWASGAMDPRCRLAIFMGKTDPGAPPHRQQSMVLVPLPAAGARVVRPLSVFGYDDAPHGHAEMLFEVRSRAALRHEPVAGVPAAFVILMPQLAWGVRAVWLRMASERWCTASAWRGAAKIHLYSLLQRLHAAGTKY